MKVNSPTWTSLDPVKPGIEQGPLNCEQTCSVITRSHCRLRSVAVAGKNVKKVFKDSRRGRKCRFSEAEVQKSQKLLGPSTIFSNAKKIRIFKKMTFLPIQASVPRPFQLYKIFFYIIYSGNIISCSKRELTEY